MGRMGRRMEAVFAERRRKRPPPLNCVDPHTTKLGESVCPHFLDSIKCWRKDITSLDAVQA